MKESTLGRPYFDLLPFQNKGDSLGLGQVLHDRFGDRGGVSANLVEADSHGELLGSLLPLRHPVYPAYLSIYDIRPTRL
jgi:hypothetical protein